MVYVRGCLLGKPNTSTWTPHWEANNAENSRKEIYPWKTGKAFTSITYFPSLRMYMRQLSGIRQPPIPQLNVRRKMLRIPRKEMCSRKTDETLAFTTWLWVWVGLTENKKGGTNRTQNRNSRSNWFTGTKGVRTVAAENPSHCANDRKENERKLQRTDPRKRKESMVLIVFILLQVLLGWIYFIGCFAFMMMKEMKMLIMTMMMLFFVAPMTTYCCVIISS